MTDFFFKTVHDCSGGKLFAEGIPNRLISHHYSNCAFLTKQLASQFDQHKQSSEHGVSSWVHLYCDLNGKIESADPAPRKIPNVIVKTFYNFVEGPQNTTYQIFTTPGISDKAIWELCKTELEVNHGRLKNIHRFVEEKIKAIKQDRGYWEALRWARTYYQLAETKNVSSMWAIYWL